MPPALPQDHKLPKSEMTYAVPHQIQPWTPHMQYFIPPRFRPSTQLSSDELYPTLIHTQPLIPGQVYIPHSDDSALPSPSTTRCSSSTLALCDNDMRKIFTCCPPGPDRMMTPPPVCEKREQLMTREVLMMSAHTYSYSAPFYAVSLSLNLNDERQKSKDVRRQPPPPLEVASYRRLHKLWKQYFDEGSRASDLASMGYYARKLFQCNNIWDEDELMHLSRALMWGASERGESATELLAAFASEVYRAFLIAPWAGTHECFQRCVVYVLWKTFGLCWNFEVSCSNL